MPPLLSIITTNYNYTDKLAGLFDNIAAQSIKDIDVIVVDDFSDVPCDNVVALYQEKGMNITLIKNSRRMFTKETRLNGIEASRGEFITFIDADDLFHGNNALEYHLKRQIETGVDILHFSMLPYEQGTVSKKPFPWAQPIADSLEGDGVFKAYARTGCHGQTLWGKIIKRALWEQCLAPARASSVRRFGEDVFLSSLLFFHARSYLGSPRLGYAREWVDKSTAKAFGRAATGYAMLAEFIPYIQERGADAESVAQVREYLLWYLRKHLLLFIETRRRQYNSSLSDELFEEMLQHAEADTILRILMTGLLQG